RTTGYRPCRLRRRTRDRIEAERVGLLMHRHPADVLQRDGNPDARFRVLDGCVDDVAAVFDRDSVAGGVAADQVALLEELALFRVVVDLHVRSDAVAEEG